MITERHSFVFPCSYPLERLGPKEELLFFDIETTGFSGDYNRLYLIGCVFFQEGSWQLIQWFADTPESEPRILDTFFNFLKTFHVLVHFNGDGFDIPFLLKRCKALGLSHTFDGLESVDIYKRIRPYRTILGMENLKQKTVEHFLGIFREDPYSGGQLIEVYEEYLQTGAPALYHMLMLHNREDLEGMPLILPILLYSDLFEQNMILKTERVQTQTDLSGNPVPYLVLTLELADTLPVPISWETSLASFQVNENLLEIRAELFAGTLKYFYPNYKDYYYLIYEDQAVHKSIGEFVEKTARKRATAQTCYSKKTGLFLPWPNSLSGPCFKKDRKEKQCYSEYVPGLFSCQKTLTDYVRYLLFLQSA